MHTQNKRKGNPLLRDKRINRLVITDDPDIGIKCVNFKVSMMNMPRIQ